MKKLIILVIGAILPVCSLFAQNVSNVTCRQSGKEIVIEYDIDKNTETVEVYVSRDGGRYFMGPLHSISGDIYDVSKGHRSIRWKVLDEFDSFTGENIVFEVRPMKTMASTQIQTKKSPKTKFQFELGAGGAYSYHIPFTWSSYTGYIYSSGLGPTAYFGIGVLTGKNYFSVEVQVPMVKDATDHSLCEWTYFGLRYRYVPDWKMGWFFGASIGYCPSTIKNDVVIIDAQIGYSFTKWLNIKANVGYPRCDVTLGINIANMFYK